MGKYKLRHGSIQVRVLALTLLFTLGVSLVIAIGNMRQLTAGMGAHHLIKCGVLPADRRYRYPPGY